MPNFIYILLNCSIRCKFTTTCCVQQRFSRPSSFISVSCFYPFLRFCIGTEVCQYEIGICPVTALGIQQRIIDFPEKLCVTGVFSINQLHEHLTDLPVRIEDILRIVASVLLVVDNQLGTETEDECIFLS